MPMYNLIENSDYDSDTSGSLWQFNPILDGLFWGFSRMGVGKKAPFPKICHTYSTMIKIDTEDQKNTSLT